MTLTTTALWFYAVMASVVFGASVYEALVVHPAWSRKPPESLAGFMGATISRMNLRGFWAPAASLYALSGLVAFAVALWAGSQRAPLVLSSACAVAAVAWTLAYFRPTIERFLERGGGGVPAERLESEVRRWILLNGIRLVMVAVSWWGALTALAAPR
ncbi:MAG: anthrone oxygenase family protein [Acidobacteriota bacterium]